MTKLPLLRPAHLTAIAACGGLIAMHQPRQAAAALASHLAITLAAGRRVALLACLAIGLGLTLASPTGGLITPTVRKEPAHDRAPQPPHARHRT